MAEHAFKIQVGHVRATRLRSRQFPVVRFIDLQTWQQLHFHLNSAIFLTYKLKDFRQNICFTENYAYICNNKYMQDMRQVEFVPFRLTDVAEIFTIKIEGKGYTELQEFIITFRNVKNNHLKNDYEQIIKSLAGIVENGVKESFFRPEGKMHDRVCCIPLLTSFRQKQNGTLRLYCIRLSDKLLIVGGGGIKTTRTYNEDQILSEHVETLQVIDKELSYLENEGKDLHKDIYNLKIHID